MYLLTDLPSSIPPQPWLFPASDNLILLFLKDVIYNLVSDHIDSNSVKFYFVLSLMALLL
jgi:hypothetical protein